MQFTQCVVAIGGQGSAVQYLDGPYSLTELMEPEPGLDQEITVLSSQDGIEAIAAVWIPQWATWEVWYNAS